MQYAKSIENSITQTNNLNQQLKPITQTNNLNQQLKPPKKGKYEQNIFQFSQILFINLKLLKKMNQVPSKKTSRSCCGMKKTFKKTPNDKSTTKKSVQNLSTKMNNLSSAVVANSSVVTQRNSIQYKSKVKNPQVEGQNTMRIKSSKKKHSSSQQASKMKTDRKTEYTKLKAKQINDSLRKKNSIVQKTVAKRVKSAFNSAHFSQTCDESFKNVSLGNNLTKISEYLKEGTDKISEIKKSSDSFVLSEMDKAQLVMAEKMAVIQRQSLSLNQNHRIKLNQINLKHKQQVEALKQQLKFLNAKIDQQNNKNTTMEKKVQTAEQQIQHIKQRFQQKQKHLALLLQQKKTLEDQKRDTNSHSSQYERSAHQLRTQIQTLRKQKLKLEQQLKKCHLEKAYIKESSVQVLKILREQFGDQLKLL